MSVALPAAAGAGQDPSAGAQEYDRPARPIMKSLDRRVRAARGSSCWTTYSEDGTGTSVCGEVFPPQSSKPLRVRRHGAIRIDMRMPTTSLHARLGGGRKLPIKRLGANGRRWRLRLPPNFRRKTTLTLLPRYTQGDSTFTATLRRRAATTGVTGQDRPRS